MDFEESDNYEIEAKEKWSNTREYKEFEEKNKNKSKKELENITEKFMDIFAELGSLKNLSIEDKKVQDKIEFLKEYITNNFYECNNEMFCILGQIYVKDERYKNNIDKAGGDGTAEFVSKAISFYCSKQIDL